MTSGFTDSCIHSWSFFNVSNAFIVLQSICKQMWKGKETPQWRRIALARKAGGLESSVADHLRALLHRMLRKKKCKLRVREQPGTFKSEFMRISFEASRVSNRKRCAGSRRGAGTPSEGPAMSWHSHPGVFSASPAPAPSKGGGAVLGWVQKKKKRKKFPVPMELNELIC